MTNDKVLKGLVDKSKKAEAAALARLQLMYPAEAQIEFFIMHGQVNPSTGKVVGYGLSHGRPFLTVLHDQSKPRGRYRYREVSLSMVLSVGGIAK